MELTPTEKGIIIEDDGGTTYLVDAYSKEVVYAKVLSDYTIDRGNNVNKIYAIKKPDSVQEENINPHNKGLKINILVGEFDKNKI